MRCLCIGICQLGAMVEILKKSKVFTTIYNEIKFYPVYEISVEKMQNILDNEVPNFDLILSQPVSNNYKNTNIYSTKTLRELALKHGKKHYVIANCYFTGYDPIPFQITNEKGEIIFLEGASYIPSLCLNNLLLHDVKGACVSWCNPNAYTKDELDRNLTLTLTELKMREDKIFDNNYGIDIRISDYVEHNFRNKHLFHTYNHPTNILIIELVKRLFERLALPYDNVILDHELLGDYSIPPPPSVYYYYKMNFEYPPHVISKIKYTTTNSAMSKYELLISKSNVDLHDRWRSTIAYGKSKLNNVS